MLFIRCLLIVCIFIQLVQFNCSQVVDEGIPEEHATDEEVTSDGFVEEIWGDEEINLDDDENQPLIEDVEEDPSIKVQVDKYLRSLSLEELDQICQERGFAVPVGSSREDFVAAATRCLSLEKEINAILASNPELAAELEAEIDRMRTEKARLEAERVDLLQQIQELQEQLAEAGVKDDSLDNLLSEMDCQKKHPSEMTFAEVFVESLSQLFHRVSKDVQFVGRLLKPVYKSAIGAVGLVWRYAKPLVSNVIPEEQQDAIEGQVKQVLGQVREKVSTAYQSVASSSVGKQIKSFFDRIIQE